MANGDEYRIRSTEMMAHALIEKNPELRAKLEELSGIYRRLADEADANEVVAKEVRQ